MPTNQKRWSGSIRRHKALDPTKQARLQPTQNSSRCSHWVSFQYKPKMAIHSTWEDYQATLPWDQSDGKEINLSLASKGTKCNNMTLRDIARNHVVHWLTLSIPLTKLCDDGEASTYKKEEEKREKESKKKKKKPKGSKTNASWFDASQIVGWSFRHLRVMPQSR